MTSGHRLSHAVYTADRGDDVVLDGLLADCTALRQLDEDLTGHYGVPGLVGDLWRAAYCRDPQLLDADEIQPRAQVNRTITAAQLGSPEHSDLRRSTVGDGFLSALAVVRQGGALRRILAQLEDERDQADQAQDKADQAAAAADSPGAGAGADAGAGGGDEETDEQAEGDGSGGESATDDDTGAAGQLGREAEQAEGDLEQALAAAPIRAAARQAARDAGEHLDDSCGRAAAWGVEDVELQRMSADERMQLASRLSSGKLREFADLIGRFRQLARAQRARRVEHVRGEYVGVTLGDDLSSLVPSELANLAVPALRAEFAARYADQHLMVYDQRGDEHEAQGAIVALIDCSFSMQVPPGASFAYGDEPPEGTATPEAYAKALTLALLEQARSSTPRRDFAAILFDEDVDTVFRFPANQPLNQHARVDLAERFSGGGTDFMEPLGAAAELVSAEYNATGRQKADIVLITDGDAWVDGTWIDQWRKTKRRLGFRAFGIEIGDGDSSAVAAACDDVRTIGDLTDTHSAAHLFRSI